jgi:branched-chain amino acid transport system ATP-binding protein
MTNGNGHTVRVVDIISGYGKKDILQGISLNVEKERITTLIGRNGVGKTTLLRTIVGFLKPRQGEIYFMGQDIIGFKPYVLADKGISYVPQGKPIFPHMTVEEHLDIGAWSLKNKEKKQLLQDRVFALFPRLQERRLQKAGTLSGGERQMLSISRALMSEPQLLLLDEPSFALSPILVNSVFGSIQEINREGVTIFLIEQNAKKAMENSDYGYVMDMGRIVLEDRCQTLLQNEEIRRTYFGGKK